MSDVGFNMSIDKAKEIIDECGLLSHVNTYVHTPSDYVGQVRGLSYPQQWERHNNNYWYNIKLVDQSLLFFKSDSFKYMMSPVMDMMSQEEFEQHEIKKLIDDGCTVEDAIELVYDDIEKDYNYYLDTEMSSRMATPVRLDIHPEQYDAKHHPLTHLHIGHENESRLPVKRIMTPYAFTCFIIATFYPNKWKELIEQGRFDCLTLASVKPSLPLVSHEYSSMWCSTLEESRFYLT